MNCLHEHQDKQTNGRLQEPITFTFKKKKKKKRAPGPELTCMPR